MRKYIIICILPKPQVRIPYNALGKVNTFEWQREDHIRQIEWRDTTQFSDCIPVQQSSNLEVLYKGGNFVLHLYRSIKRLELRANPNNS